MAMMNRRQIDDLIHKVREKRDKQFHKVLSLTTDEDAKILSAVETRNLVTFKKLDPSDNIAFLAKRCRRYGRSEAVNAITEELYDEAYTTAMNLEDDKPLEYPPLYGVPISVKDNIALKGCYSTGGLACRLTRVDRADSLAVQCLRSAGAIPLCRGNVVQGLMLAESVNRIWGRTSNPWDLSRSPGGSSGGDAALVAMGCVPLAACSDEAGSIRIPAIWNGVVGFKPTSNRISMKGCMKPRKDDKAGTTLAIPPVVGPIARNVEDCTFFMRSLFTAEFFENDLSVPPLLFNEDAYQDTTELKIGYFESDGFFEPCITAKRALKETVRALQKEGHNCVPFQPPTDGWEAYHLMVSLNAAEGKYRYKESLEGEPMIPEYRNLQFAAGLPGFLRWPLSKVSSKRYSHLLGCTHSNGLNAYEFCQLSADIMDMREKWSDAVQNAGLDAIIYPALPLPAMPHGMSSEMTMAFSMMFITNLLMWPSGVVPVTCVRADEQVYPKEDLPREQRDRFAYLASKVMEHSEGLPMGVNVTAPTFEDERCLRVMKEVQNLTDFKAEPEAYKRVIDDVKQPPKQEEKTEVTSEIPSENMKDPSTDAIAESMDAIGQT